MREDGVDLDHAVLVVQHVLGCGGSGYRLKLSDRPLDEGRDVVVSGLRLSFDPVSYSRLDGGAIDYDPGKETEGFFLDHPDAASAAFC